VIVLLGPGLCAEHRSKQETLDAHSCIEEGIW
jgi:hypothetical protein